MLVVWMMGTQPDTQGIHKVIHTPSGEKMLEKEGLGRGAFMLSQGCGRALPSSSSKGGDASMRWIRRLTPALVFALSPPSTAIHRGKRRWSRR